MAITTGVLLLGDTWQPKFIQTALGNQLAALEKGAFNNTADVKQRWIIVESAIAKANLQRLLTSQQLTYLPQPEDFDVNQEHKAKMSAYGTALSQRVITVRELHEQNKETKLNKLYVDALSAGVGSATICATYHKSSALSFGLKSAFAGGAVSAGFAKMAGYSGQDLVKITACSSAAAACLGAMHQAGKADYEDKELSGRDLALKLINLNLKCADIRLLCYNSGDRAETRDITSDISRQAAREAEGKASHAEALVEGFRFYPSGKHFTKVSGYQGKQGSYLKNDGEEKGHQMRRSNDRNEEKLIRQSTVRVEHRVGHRVWP